MFIVQSHVLDRAMTQLLDAITWIWLVFVNKLLQNKFEGGRIQFKITLKELTKILKSTVRYELRMLKMLYEYASKTNLKPMLPT